MTDNQKLFEWLGIHWHNPQQYPATLESGDDVYYHCDCGDESTEFSQSIFYNLDLSSEAGFFPLLAALEKKGWYYNLLRDEHIETGLISVYLWKGDKRVTEDAPSIPEALYKASLAAMGSGQLEEKR